MEKQIKIALAGNPNSGKTTLFNALTGSNQFVGNWPGVTVEKKEGKLKKHDDVVIMDLPGIYSLSPYTLEEVVSRNYLITERPDAILNIVDGTNLERNLYLTTQLTELGIPVVVAINMMDVVKKNGDQINIKELSRQLGCPVLEISALKGTGIMEAAEAAVKAAAGPHTEPQHTFSGPVEHATLLEVLPDLGDVLAPELRGPSQHLRTLATPTLLAEDPAQGVEEVRPIRLDLQGLAHQHLRTLELDPRLDQRPGNGVAHVRIVGPQREGLVERRRSLRVVPALEQLEADEGVVVRPPGGRSPNEGQSNTRRDRRRPTERLELRTRPRQAPTQRQPRQQTTDMAGLRDQLHAKEQG